MHKQLAVLASEIKPPGQQGSAYPNGIYKYCFEFKVWQSSLNFSNYDHNKLSSQMDMLSAM